MSHHKNADVRKAAENLVAEVYSPRIAKLIEQLGDDEFDKREEADKQLLRIGTYYPAAAIRTLLHHPPGA